MLKVTMNGKKIVMDDDGITIDGIKIGDLEPKPSKPIKEYIVLDKRETVFESIVKDGVTFGLLALCAWVSHGSKFWTLVTGCLFLLHVMAMASPQRKTLKSKAELKEYVESLDDDD